MMKCDMYTLRMRCGSDQAQQALLISLTRTKHAENVCRNRKLACTRYTYDEVHTHSPACVCVCVYVCVCMFLYMSFCAYLSIYTSPDLSTLSAYTLPSICPSVRLWVCQPVRPSIYPAVQPKRGSSIQLTSQPNPYPSAPTIHQQTIRYLRQLLVASNPVVLNL